MSSPDPNLVGEMTTEVDTRLEEEKVLDVDREGTIASLLGSERASSDLDSVHRSGLQTVKALKQSLKERENQMWYEVAGSILNHNLRDAIRESSGMPEGYDVAMPSASDRAHEPPEGYHTFYTDQIDMILNFSFPS